MAMKLIVLSCLFALVFASKKPDTPVFLCGRNLAVARVLVCYGAEYVMKRSFSDYTNPGEVYEDQLNEVDWPWGGRQGSLTADWTRYKRDGIVEECCLKPCTTDVLLNYC